MISGPTSPPQLSVHLLNFAAEDPGSWEHLIERAVEAEAAGVDRVVVSDHVAFGEDLDAYGDPRAGGSEGARQPTGPDGCWLEPLTVLAAVSTRTSRVRLGTSVLLATLRTPVVLAKAVATLDALSGGRVDLGVGVGWQRAEHDAAGRSFERRGEELDACLALVQRLWREPVVHLPSGPVHQMPKPKQPGGVPIWVSGRSTNRRVRERVARFGSGWIPWGDDARDPRAGIAAMRAAMAAAGRDEDALAVTTSLPEDPAELTDLVAAGVTDFRVGARNLDGASLDEVVARFRELTSAG